MPFRFSLQPPKDLLDLFGRIRDLLPQLEPKILANVPVGVTVTAIAHGMRATPRFVRASSPHCLALVRQEKPADEQNIYLRASNECVVDVELVR
jgi:hypothetical protein